MAAVELSVHSTRTSCKKAEEFLGGRAVVVADDGTMVGLDRQALEGLTVAERRSKG